MTWGFLYMCVWLRRGWSWPQPGLLLPPFCPSGMFLLSPVPGAWVYLVSQFREPSWPKPDSGEVIALQLIQLPEPINGTWPWRCRGQCWKGKLAGKDGSAAASALVRLNPTKLCPEGGEAWFAATKSWSPCLLLLCTVSCCFPSIGAGMFLILC